MSTVVQTLRGARVSQVAQDTTAPTYSVNPAASVSGTTITVTATASDETDPTVDHYAVLVANGATAPSAAQVKAGNDSTDSAALDSGSDLGVANGVEGSIALTGPAESTAYDAYYAVEDQSGNITDPDKVDATTGTTASGFTAESGFELQDNEDGTYTITDSSNRMGTKPGGAKSLLVYEFGRDGSQSPASESRITNHPDWNFSKTWLTIDTGGGHFNGRTNALKRALGGTDTEEPALQSTTAFLNNDVSDPTVYVFLRCRMNWTAQEQDDANTNWNWKDIRILSASNRDANPGMAFLDGQQGGDGTPRYQWRHAGTNGGADGGTTDVRTRNGINWDHKNWRNIEHLITPSSSATGGNESWEDGAKAADETDIKTSSGAGDEFKYVEGWADEISSMSGDPAMFTDRIIFDDSPAQVFITDAATWTDNGTDIREVQLTSAWAAGSVTYTEELGKHSSRTGKSLWVRKSDRTLLLVGSWS